MGEISKLGAVSLNCPDPHELAVIYSALLEDHSRSRCTGPTCPYGAYAVFDQVRRRPTARAMRAHGSISWWRRASRASECNWFPTTTWARAGSRS